MLSDEEKKAIEYLKQNDIVEIQYDNYGLESIHRVGIDEKQIILNLIEKQSKEIEELNKSDASKEQSSMNYYNLYRELVDKIKAKIEVLEKLQKEFPNNDEIRIKIIAYKELLEKE